MRFPTPACGASAWYSTRQFIVWPCMLRDYLLFLTTAEISGDYIQQGGHIIHNIQINVHISMCTLYQKYAEFMFKKTQACNRQSGCNGLQSTVCLFFIMLFVLFVQYYNVICCPTDHAHCMVRPRAKFRTRDGTLITRPPPSFYFRLVFVPDILNTVASPPSVTGSVCMRRFGLFWDSVDTVLRRYTGID